jgi:excisionase family DNA binding protein
MNALVVSAALAFLFRSLWPKISIACVFACVNTRNELHLAPRMLYDRKEAARQLSISVRSLDYLIAAKKIGTRRLGKKVLIPHGELVRFASANHYESVTPEPRAPAAAA